MPAYHGAKPRRFFRCWQCRPRGCRLGSRSRQASRVQGPLDQSIREGGCPTRGALQRPERSEATCDHQLLEADSEGAAREIIGSLPLVKAGMLELVKLIPLLPYRGFGPRS
jgi:hypothetical protein